MFFVSLEMFLNSHFCVFFPLLSVLKTFLHDPLVEWSKQAKGLSKAQANETGEIVNEKVFTCINILVEFFDVLFVFCF